jgi:hypothetical protein
MESPQPPKKPEIVIIQSIDTQQPINKTLPLQRQKSNFKKQLDSLKAESSFHQEQLDFLKTALSECQHQTKKDHKQLKILNKGFGGFIEDQGRTNRELRTNMANIDTEELRLDMLIQMLAQTATSLEKRVKTVEQNNSTKPSYSSIPQIMITPPDSTQKELLSYKKETQEKFKKLEKLIIDLIDLKEEQEDALTESEKKIEQNEKDIALLKTIVTEQQNALTKMHLYLTVKAEADKIELQKLITMLDNKNGSNEL